MIIAFDYARLGGIESAQSPLVVSVNGQEVLINHGIDVINGKFGSLGICRDGRYSYEVYPEFLNGTTHREEFHFNIDDGSRFRLVFHSEGGRLQTLQYVANHETGEWEELPCPGQAD